MNDNSFPDNQIIETIIRLSSFNIDTDTIIKLICSLDPNNLLLAVIKTSLHITKLCAMSISKPLHILFNDRVMNGCFPNE